MSAPACYVIGAAEWDQAASSVAWAFTVCLFAVWAAGVDWWLLFDCLRRYRRRRRIAALRARRA